ncbi:superoxide dismutase [Candidatus Saccharibacteria bacterium]|nr:superoxide dismutase [Candidatus Saccharibacteria bacterium]
MSLEATPLKYKSLPGLSEKQLSEHHDVLYAGYVKKYNEIVEKLQTVDLDSTNGTYSNIRELQLEKSFALNGIKLHEYYFDNMTDKPNQCSGKVKELIEKQWGSVDKWAAEFSAMGIASRGWVVLGWNYDTEKLENYLCDMHNQGGVWNTQTLLVMDVYEHAYFLDYATARKDYVAAFMKLIDWDEVNTRATINHIGQ